MRGFLSGCRSMERVICRRRSVQNWRGHLFWWSVRREQWAGIDRKELVKDVVFFFASSDSSCWWALFLALSLNMPTAQVLTVIEGEFSTVKWWIGNPSVTNAAFNAWPPRIFFAGDKWQQTYPTPLHPLPPPCTSAAERLGHSEVQRVFWISKLCSCN